MLDKGKPLERVGRKTTGLSSSLQSRDMTAGLPGTAVPPLDGCYDHLTIRGWTPTIKVLFARDLTDDCTGALLLGKWSLEQIGIKSRVVTLEGNGEHAVCISEDKSIMISNNSVVEIPPEAWTEAVLTWFTPAFKKISLNLPARS